MTKKMSEKDKILTMVQMLRKKDSSDPEILELTKLVD